MRGSAPSGCAAARARRPPRRPRPRRSTGQTAAMLPVRSGTSSCSGSYEVSIGGHIAGDQLIDEGGQVAASAKLPLDLAVPIGGEPHEGVDLIQLHFSVIIDARDL